MINVKSRSISIKAILLTILLPIVVYALLSFLRPDIYLQKSTFIMLLKQALSNIIIGWSMVFGMSVGLFDFSVGARILLAAFFGIHMSQHFGVAGFVVGCIVSSIIIAILTGLIYASLKIPSIITGFSALLIFESLAVIYQNRITVIIGEDISVFGVSPGIYIVSAITFIVVYLLFNNTKFGYQIKAIGGNEAIARSMGINSVRIKLLTYVVGGLILAFATMVKVGYAGTIRAMTNMNSMVMCFTPMMGVMIGLYLSSCNPVIGVFIGGFTITIVSSGLVALGIESRLQNVVVGIFLILFIGWKTNYYRVQALINRLRHKNIPQEE